MPNYHCTVCGKAISLSREHAKVPENLICDACRRANQKPTEDPMPLLDHLADQAKRVVDGYLDKKKAMKETASKDSKN